MLSFILGSAGTGKTTLLLKRLEQVAKSGEQGILLVPEQYSFEAELQVGRAIGPRLALEVEVLSFTRLCNVVFRACGGLSGRTITKTGRYLLMSLAVSQVQDRLDVYKKSGNNTAFLQMLVDAVAELKAAGLSPPRLEEITASCASGPLGDKLRDICILYSAFQALLEQSYTDSDDDLIRACGLLKTSELFSDKHVFVDGFNTFMAAEMDLLCLLTERAKSVTFAITADSIDDNREGMGIFSPAKQTIRRLMRVARTSGVAVESPEILGRPVRYKSPELALISRTFFQPEGEYFSEKPEALTLHRAEDPYREIEWVAAQICAFVQNEGYRYRDIALVARETAPYIRSIESVFLREKIPFFADIRRDVENMPLGRGLLSAMEVLRSNFDSEAVLAFANNPIAGLDPDDIAELENYVYIWSIKGSLWEEQWQNNPRGMVGALTQADAGHLEKLNELRHRATWPLISLRERLRDCDGKMFASGIYNFLGEVGASENLVQFADYLPQGERETFLDECSQLWDYTMEILDVFAAALGSSTLQMARFADLLCLSLTAAEIGLRPQTLDGVLVGKADRIRPGEVKAVFVIGAAEGQFPPSPTGAGFFTDAERRQMIELGAEIGAPALSRAVIERFHCYHALTLASEQLFVSYPGIKLSGAQHSPSWLVAQLLEMFPRLETTQLSPIDQAYSRGAVLELLAGQYREDTAQTAALVQLLGEQKDLAALSRAAFKQEHKIVDSEIARELFGSKITLSPTRVERYHRCAFSYFANDGLRLRKRVRVEFSPLEAGSVLHHVLHVMTARHGKALFELPTKQLGREIKQIIDGYLNERVSQMQALPHRFRHLYDRLSTSLIRILRRLGEEFAQSEYISTAFELPIQMRDSEELSVKPLELVTADGVRVSVEGVVDRVDVMQRGQNRYIRVVDYKSGAKQFRLDDVISGINLQMLLYLFTIAENGQGSLGGAIAAGVLYMPAGDKYIAAERGADDDTLESARQKQWKMSGLLLDDEESLRGMERELRGVFIPAKMGKDGWDKSSALADKAEMGRLSRKIREIIAEMADCLSMGSIPARPLRSGDFDPCNYCEMNALCGFEPGDGYRQMAQMDREKVLAMLMEEGENDA